MGFHRASCCYFVGVAGKVIVRIKFVVQFKTHTFFFLRIHQSQILKVGEDLQTLDCRLASCVPQGHYLILQ